jgi:uncharacterized protein with FMN-binding domain
MKASPKARRALRYMATGSALLALSALVAACTVDKEALARQVGLHNVDLTSVPDGVYEGAYTVDLPKGVMAAGKSVRVRVTVSNAKFEKIEVLDPISMSGAGPIRELLSRVTADQRLSPDAITSATVSSIAVLRAIQEAVSKAGARAVP